MSNTKKKITMSEAIPKAPRFYSVGDCFINKDSEDLYVLAMSGQTYESDPYARSSYVHLVNMKYGTAFNKDVIVKDANNITKSELNQIMLIDSMTNHDTWLPVTEVEFEVKL